MKAQTTDHAKTILLGQLLGCPRYHTWGLLEGLWQFAAAYCPTGSLSGKEKLLCTWIGWEKDEKVLLDALNQAGWLDGEPDNYCVHDWDQHAPNYIHRLLARKGSTFVKGSIRESYLTKDEQKKLKPKSTEKPTKTAEPKTKFDLMAKWNEKAAEIDIKPCDSMTEKRKAALRERLKDQFWVANADAALDKLKDMSQFYFGQNNTGWKMNIDWFLRPDTVVKIMEEKNDDPRGHGLTPSSDNPFG